MPVAIAHSPADPDEVLAQLIADGFDASRRDYQPDSTEPHRHDYDVCLYVIEGEIKVFEDGVAEPHACGPGDRLMVPAGTVHHEEHGALRMIVGRRHLPESAG
jgi:mannose-6-phosphate isomerase-like protein (cupin superfamily)